VISYSGVDMSVMSPAELADELGTRVRSERLRQNLSQEATTIEQFLGSAQPLRQRGRR
jgi:hypothetical protein